MKNYNKTKKTQTAQKSKQLDAIEHLKLFIPDLPEDLVINGNLNLADKIIKVLPDNLTINGNLDLTGCDNLGELPLNLTVNGNFSIDSSINGMLLRPCTKIKGNFYKHWYDNIPENFTIGGDLIVSDNIGNLPQGLTVMGNLDLSSTKIKELPDRLKVMGNLDIAELEIYDLPRDLFVGGFLNARKTKLRSFPETVVVNGGFNISYTKIKIFPRQFNYVIGDILISQTAIRLLPNNLTVVGGLYIDNTPIAELPENLHVYGVLSCGETYIESIPESLNIEYSLYLEGCPIEKLPDNLIVKGSLNICETNIAEFPAGLIVNNDLEFSDTPIKELPRFMNVGGMHIDNTRITHLPENFSVTGNLHIWYCDDKEVCLSGLPKGMKVGGNLRFSRNLFGSLPEGLFVGGDLDLSEQRSIRKLPKDFTIKGKLKLGYQPSLIHEFTWGERSIDGIIEIPYSDFRCSLISTDYFSEDLKARLKRVGDSMTIMPVTKEAPKKPNSVKMRTAKNKAA